jgi:peptidoglycan/xylan/chitin deacetylase (PgdA/CDA1 family)
MSEFGAATLRAQQYTCVLWNVLPGDWRDPAGWVDHALDGIKAHSWSVVVLHDVADAALPRLDEFLTAVAERNPTWSRDFPDECTPIRDGVPTSSFGTLCIAN